MKENLTEVIIILDESGSMSFCKSDTIGGFNEFINTQKKIKGDVNITFVKFSDYYKMINDGTPIKHVNKLNDENYTPSNTTSLLDAVGKTFNTVGQRLSNTKEEERPSKILVAIITDGYENSSKEFTKNQISDMVKHQKEKYNWEILFIGAEIHAWGSEIGILNNVNTTYSNMSSTYRGLSHYAANYRCGNNISMMSFDKSDAEIEDELKTLCKDDGNKLN